MRTNTRRAMAQVDRATMTRWAADSTPARETESAIRKAPRLTHGGQAEFAMVNGVLVRIVTGSK